MSQLFPEEICLYILKEIKMVDASDDRIVLGR